MTLWKTRASLQPAINYRLSTVDFPTRHRPALSEAEGSLVYAPWRARPALRGATPSMPPASPFLPSICIFPFSFFLFSSVFFLSFISLTFSLFVRFYVRILSLFSLIFP